MSTDRDLDEKRYTGTFNGNSHTVIVMLAIGVGNLGLSGISGGNATIKRTSITDSRIETEAYHVGGVAGYVNGTGITIAERGDKGNLTGKGAYLGSCVGGTGSIAEVTLKGCYNEGGSMVSNSAGSSIGSILGLGRAPSFKSCRVTVRDCMDRGTTSGVSVAGGAIGNRAQVAITGCYHAERVTTSGSGIVGSTAGYGDVESTPTSGCLTERPYATRTSVNGVLVKTKGMGTWGVAWRLDRSNLKQSTGPTWTYVEGNSYPVLNTTELSPAESWESIGRALEYGLLRDTSKPDGDDSVGPYQI